MWDEQMPEQTVLMTLALKSPETRQNKARAPGNSPADVCAHVRVLRRAAPSLPPAWQAEPTAAACFGEVSGSRSEKNDSVAATGLPSPALTQSYRKREHPVLIPALLNFLNSLLTEG